MKRLLFLLICLLCACASTIVKNKNEESPINILEQFISDNWDTERLKSTLGTPKEIVHDNIWVYSHKTTKYQEWAFEFDKDGKASSVTYVPTSDHLKEFELENLKTRWSRYNCENKEKEILYNDFIKNIKYVSCDRDKRYIEYNKYNEVSFVSISR